MATHRTPETADGILAQPRSNTPRASRLRISHNALQSPRVMAMISSVAPSSPRPPGTHRCQHDVHQVMGDQEASGISASALSKNVIQETLELAPDRTPSLHIMDIAQQGHLLRHSKRLTGSDIPKIGTSSRLANTAQRQHHRGTSNRCS